MKFINTRPRGRLGKKGYIYKNVGIFNGRFNRRLSTFFDMWHSRSRSSFLVALFPVGCRPRNPESQRWPTLPTALPSPRPSYRRFRGCGGSGTRVGRRRLSTTPGHFPAAPSSSPSLLASCFTPSVGREGTRLTRGEERDEKRGGGGEREKKRREKLVEISRRRKRGRGKERRKEVPRIDSEAANRKPRHRKSHFCGQSPLASVAYFDRIRESLERRGAISWRTCPDPFAAPARRRLEEIETRGIY